MCMQSMHKIIIHHFLEAMPRRPSLKILVVPQIKIKQAEWTCKCSPEVEKENCMTLMRELPFRDGEDEMVGYTIIYHC